MDYELPPNSIIAKWYSWGRGGTLEGIFVTTKEELASIYGKDIHFGEIDGKHSDVTMNFEEKDFEILDTDQSFIQRCVEIFGANIAGYNPVDYYISWLQDNPEEDEDAST